MFPAFNRDIKVSPHNEYSMNWWTIYHCRAGCLPGLRSRRRRGGGELPGTWRATSFALWFRSGEWMTCPPLFIHISCRPTNWARGRPKWYRRVKQIICSWLWEHDSGLIWCNSTEETASAIKLSFHRYSLLCMLLRMWIVIISYCHKIRLWLYL